MPERSNNRLDQFGRLIPLNLDESVALLLHLLFIGDEQCSESLRLIPQLTRFGCVDSARGFPARGEPAEYAGGDAGQSGDNSTDEFCTGHSRLAIYEVSRTLARPETAGTVASSPANRTS